MAQRASVQVEVGAQVRALRLRRGWSLAQLGAAAGLTRQAIYRIEAGETASPITTYEVIARALGVPLAGLMPESKGKH